MAIEMVNAPAQREPENAGHPAASGPAGDGARADVRRLWGRVLRVAALVPLVVLAPLTALAPTADHRFNIYWHGADFRTNPLHLVTENFQTIPIYLQSGNFRPFGRMVEGGIDLAAYLLMELLNLPANVAFRVVSFLAAAVLTAVAVIFAESIVSRGRLFGEVPSRLAAVVPFAVGAVFVAAGSMSTTVLFGGLYLLSTALVIAVAAVACRLVTTAGGRLGPLRAGLTVLAGALLAAFNEIAYLAPPLVVLAVLLRGRVVLGLGWRTTLTGAGGRFAGLLWLGFLPVFLPVRAIIYRRCSTGDCYRGSDVVLGADALHALPNRLLSWLPPLQWGSATRQAEGTWLVGLLPLVALLLLALLAWRVVTVLPHLSAVDRRQAAGLAAVAASLLTLGSMLAAMNGDMQAAAIAGRWGDGWRESGLTGVGGALTVLGLCLVLVSSGRPTTPPARGDDRQRLAVLGLVAVLVLTASVSAAANRTYHNTNAGRATNILNNAIAHEVANFDRSSAGNARRCALREQFRQSYPGAGYSPHAGAELPGTFSPVDRLEATVNRATRQLAGRPFCRVAR